MHTKAKKNDTLGYFERLRENKEIGSITRKGEQKGECTERYECKGPSQRGEWGRVCQLLRKKKRRTY